MRNPFKELLVAISRIPGLLLELGRFWRGLVEIIRAICRIIHRLWRGQKRPPRPRDYCCKHLPPDVYKRPDPLIYAQYYLMKMGLAVTWDNPDIQLFEYDPTKPEGVGTPVSSSALQPDHLYAVVVRVWNGSYDAPAVHLPVHLSYLTFGVNTTSTAIGTRLIDLGVKGSPQHPAFAFFKWQTPAAAGHYCLQALLQWADDANPDNNLGQENVNVGVLHSPAQFTFVLRNDASVRRHFVFEADAYTLPKRQPCDDPDAVIVVPGERGRGDQRQPPSRLAESKARWAWALQRQAYGQFPVPPDWAVTIAPNEAFMLPGAEQVIQVAIEPKGPGATIPKAFNIHAFALDENSRTLEGGVTLVVTKA